MASPSFRAESTRSIPVVREAHGRAGRWELCLELSSGGMATVYLAYARGPMGVGKLAAVKVIRADLAAQHAYVDMFLDEARIASMIHHPNVCATYELGRTDESYYIAMEYLAGESVGALRRALAERAETRAIDRALLAARVIADAAEGLHAAHELRDLATGEALDVVHRDVSPQNVLVTYDGAVRVLDFGVARAAGRLHHTTPGTVKGKFAYMAPEQMCGAAIDRRVDVWSLGVVLWELLAGRRLFHFRTEAETARAVTSMPIPTLDAAWPDAPPALVQIVARALERDPDRRFGTARDMSLELTTFSTDAGRPMGAPEVSEWMRSAFAKRVAQKDALVRVAVARGRHAEDATAPAPGPVERLEIEVDHDDDDRAPTTPASTRSWMMTPHATATVSRRSRARHGRDSVLLGVALVLFAGSMWTIWRARSHTRPSRPPAAIVLADASAPDASTPIAAPIVEPALDAAISPVVELVDAARERSHAHRRRLHAAAVSMETTQTTQEPIVPASEVPASTAP